MKSKKHGINYAKYGYLFSIPFIVTFLIFSLYPTIYTAVLGFTDCKGLGNTDWHFLDNPFDNFKNVLDNPSFITSLKNTAVIWIINFIPQITIALLLTAWFTSKRNKILLLRLLLQFCIMQCSVIPLVLLMICSFL